MAANNWVMNAATVGLGFAGFYTLREYMRGGQCKSDVRMDGKGMMSQFNRTTKHYFVN